jgi:hypothetical protein
VFRWLVLLALAAVAVGSIYYGIRILRVQFKQPRGDTGQVLGACCLLLLGFGLGGCGLVAWFAKHYLW